MSDIFLRGLKVLVYRLLGVAVSEYLVLTFCVLLIVETSIIRVLCTTTSMLCIHLIFCGCGDEHGLCEQSSLSLCVMLPREQEKNTSDITHIMSDVL